MWRTAFALGHAQAWLAERINHRTIGWPLLLPAWAITRSLFVALCALCCWHTTRRESPKVGGECHNGHHT